MNPTANNRGGYWGRGVASIFAEVALGWCARKARAPRFLATVFAVAALAGVVAPTDARAQFVCSPSTPPVSNINVTCTITGNFAGLFQTQVTGTGNATTINLQAGTVDDIETTAETGNALTNNYGAVAGSITTTTTVSGDATTTNFSTGTTTAIFTQAAGNATTNNAGVAGVISTEADLGGNAVSINSGLAGIIQTYTTQNGDATTFNTATGTVLGIIDTHTNDGGNATTNNAGFIVGFPGTPGISTVTNNGGNATSNNTGVVNGGINTVTGFINLGGDATTLNSGTINGDVYTSAADSFSGAGNALFVNFGKVTSDTQGVSVLTTSGNASFTNSGAVDVSNAISFSLPGFDVGIFVASQDGNATAYNGGSILGGIGVAAGNFGNATLTNAGLIDGTKSPFGIAVDMTQYDPTAKSTLNILPGSRILGEIVLSGYQGFGFPGTSVNFYSGNISSVTTFGSFICGCNEGGLFDTPSTINVIGGAPYVVDRNNNTVVILDPTSFALQDRNILDVTRIITSLATSRLTNPAPISGDGSAAIGFAPSGNVARDMANDAFANIPALSYAGQDRVLRSNPNFTAADGTSVWAQGFGGLRVQEADGPNLRSVNSFYGGVLGLDKAVRPGIRLGGFIGAGNVTSNIDQNSGSTTSDMAFGGVYGRYQMNRAFLDFALLGGGSSNDVKRTMTNNLVPGGYETASGSYNGWFISPELAYGVRQDLIKNWTVTPTVRVRYLAANFGGYQESGSSSNLTVAGRTTHNFEERGELVFTRTTKEREDSQLRMSGTFGVLAWQRAGDAMLNTVLLGQTLAFAAPGQGNVVGGYTGFSFDWRQKTGISVFGATEVTAMSDSSFTISGRGGVKAEF
ncbi:MAG: autotransporter domain-containing protein [Xanthobacteraceae bacterium]|nr:autotransporter domain-containing protein [Xanthobacteraceae bacterium]